MSTIVPLMFMEESSIIVLLLTSSEPVKVVLEPCCPIVAAAEAELSVVNPAIVPKLLVPPSTNSPWLPVILFLSMTCPFSASNSAITPVWFVYSFIFSMAAASVPAFSSIVVSLILKEPAVT